MRLTGSRAVIRLAVAAACSTLLTVWSRRDYCDCTTEPERLAASHLYLPALTIALLAALRRWLARAPPASSLPAAWLRRRPTRARVAALRRTLAGSVFVRFVLAAIVGLAFVALALLVVASWGISLAGPGAAPFRWTHTALLIVLTVRGVRAVITWLRT